MNCLPLVICSVPLMNHEGDYAGIKIGKSISIGATLEIKLLFRILGILMCTDAENMPNFVSYNQKRVI